MLNLITLNRWWDTGRVDTIYALPYKRELFHQVVGYLDARQIVVIYGLRRTGKTTLMYQLIDYILRSGIPKKHILYFSFDEKVTSLEELMKSYSELVLAKEISKEKRIYVFLDEVQKLEDWENQLKMYYDLYPNVKFIVSGSASIMIQKKTTESLAGRIYEFILPLLPFKEFLELKKESVIVDKNMYSDFNRLKEIYLGRERIAPYLVEYAKKGGFIELTEESDDEKIKRYASSIIEHIVFVDLAAEFNIRHSQVLKTIVELIASNPGFLLDYTHLSRVLSIDQRVIADYIHYLKYAFLVKSLYNFSKSRFVSERKLKKIYLGSTNFIYGIHSTKFFDPIFLGKVMENLAVINADTQFFWRLRNHEVDMIDSENVPIEVKYKEKISEKDSNSLIKFCTQFKVKRGMVITKQLLDKKEKEGIELLYIPLWIFLLRL